MRLRLPASRTDCPSSSSFIDQGQPTWEEGQIITDKIHI